MTRALVIFAGALLAVSEAFAASAIVEMVIQTGVQAVQLAMLAVFAALTTCGIAVFAARAIFIRFDMFGFESQATREKNERIHNARVRGWVRRWHREQGPL